MAIDPKTGERIPGGPSQIDPKTGERIVQQVAGAGPLGLPQPKNPAVQMQAPALGSGPQIAADALKGAGKGALNTVNGVSTLINKIPVVGETLAPSSGIRAARIIAQPHNTPQKIGYGAEQAGEFLIPGGAEEKTGLKILEAAPKLEKAAPAIKVGLAALGSGAVNKAQGGSFTGGALAGGIGSGVAQGLKAAAPAIAESALNIRKLDRAYKEPQAIGNAILNETTGFSPAAIAESAQGKLNVLNPALNAAADAASVAPNPVRGLLPAPAIKIPLGEVPTPGEMPGGLYDARPFPAQNVGEARVIRSPNGQILPKSARNIEFPDASGKLPPGRNYDGKFLTRQPSRTAWMTGFDGEVPATPEFSGPGVLLRQPAAGAGPIPSMIPNATASLSGARRVVTDALGTAMRQGERTTLSQLQPLATHLGESIDGTPIPENITPRQLLDLKRGIGSEFIHRWNPETMTGVKGTAGQAYHALADEFNNAVPGARDLNNKISTMIPIAKRAESLELNAPTAQKIAQRIAAPTGALVGPLIGGAEGYEHGGMKGGLEGAALGLLGPALFTTPTGQMILARVMNSGAVSPGLKLLTGAGLQMSSRNKNTTTKAPQ